MPGAETVWLNLTTGSRSHCKIEVCVGGGGGGGGGRDSWCAVPRLDKNSQNLRLLEFYLYLSELMVTELITV